VKSGKLEVRSNQLKVINELSVVKKVYLERSDFNTGSMSSAFTIVSGGSREERIPME
jgi:hypothetical protein